MTNTTTSTSTPADTAGADEALARLLDQQAIRDTIERFDDAATHADFDAFATLWAPVATGLIGRTEDPPYEPLAV